MNARNSVYRPNQIIRSLLDTDWYKFLMMQAMFHQCRFATDCVYKFHARTDEDLTPYIPQIKAELEALCELHVTQSEIMFLESQKVFSKDFLQYLKHFTLDFSTLRIWSEKQGDGSHKFNLEAHGSAVDETHFEIFVMEIISEVRNRTLHPDVTYEDVRKRLYDKIRMLESAQKEFGLEGYNLVDMGSRRRLSYETQLTVVKSLSGAVPDLFGGTSNIFIARELRQKLIGTQAHEWYQLWQQGSNQLGDSINAALEAWVQEYRGKNAIALTDIITMDAFCDNFDLFYGKVYDGMRHDSGCPYVWAEKAIKHYEKLGLDPKHKTLVFSDGLNIPKTIDLWKEFHKHTNLTFGVGTNLSNDVEGITPLNMVMKLLTVNGRPTAKISDSPGKTLCQDESFINYLKTSFGVAA